MDLKGFLSFLLSRKLHRGNRSVRRVLHCIILFSKHRREHGLYTGVALLFFS